MPLPHAIGRANKRLLNPVVRLIAPRFPGLAVVDHRGRRSGTPYHTPVILFRSGSEMVIALTYGSQVDWVRNLLASEGGTVRSRGSTVRVGTPVIRRDDTGGVRIPGPVRAILSRLGVREYLHLTVLGR
jgi:deazaflavin-dependent oxidoreductase (nitroreductase family)